MKSWSCCKAGIRYIAPHLCAQCSIKSAEDLDHVASMIRRRIEAGNASHGVTLNMLFAIDGQPAMANRSFVPTYPTDGLLGNVHPYPVLNLLPFDPVLSTPFSRLNFPERGPTAVAAAEIFSTIGDFYEPITQAFDTLKPPIGTAPQVEIDLGAGNDTVFKITSIADPIGAIEEIKEQGEGTDVKSANGVCRPTGLTIRMPCVMPFKRSSDPHASDDFSISVSDLLRLLRQPWTGSPATMDKAVESNGHH
ncbi:MAG: hypothetical protein JO121_30060 [Deltaproteobacteria bacterium]|nr:hypothetical protein [Deltaproteobacteria bacterium]